MPSLSYVTENRHTYIYIPFFSFLATLLRRRHFVNSYQYQIGFATGKNKITYSPHIQIVYISNHMARPSFRILGQF